jgi:chaperone BCS1
VQSGSLVAKTHQRKKTWKDYRDEWLMGERRPPKMDYQPANNNDVHVVRYGGARILMNRSKGETVTVGSERTPMQLESLTLSSFGSRVEPIKALIDDALRSSYEEQLDEMSVFVLSDMWCSGWEKALSKKPRAIESVILDEDLADTLLRDARDFLQSAGWYSTVGIPYRRGYLLHGPPGCGKTSFCQALAGALKLDVCMLTLTNKNLDDNGLAQSLRDAPTNSIVLLEDVDAVFVDRSVNSKHGGSGVTFSGLLNAIDGVASQEGRLFFMTTNHIEKLDPALIRPGRCDVKVEVRRASRCQAARLFGRFYPAEEAAKAQTFADALPEHELSMAQLQGFLLEHKTDAAGALAHVPRLLRSSKPASVDRMLVSEHLRRVGLQGRAP